MGVINRTQIADLLVQGLKTVAGLDYIDHPKEWAGVFKSYDSERAYERDAFMTGLGNAVIRNEGEQTEMDEGGEAYVAVYNNVELALGFVVTKVAIEDNVYMDTASKYTKALTRSFLNAEEIMAASVLNNGTSSSYPGGDGVALFSTAHPTKSGVTQANNLLIPADLSETALEDVLINISGAQDDRRLPVLLNADRLIVPKELTFTAQRLLKSAQRPGTADNDINAINHMGLLSKPPQIMRRLTSTSNWFVTTDVVDGMKMFDRLPFTERVFDDPRTDNFEVRGRRRLSFGWTNWRGIYGSVS
jgi:hypothetical protein